MRAKLVQHSVEAMSDGVLTASARPSSRSADRPRAVRKLAECACHAIALKARSSRGGAARVVAPFIRCRSPIGDISTAAARCRSANDATELAKKLQNPIGDLYSIPFQNNTNFNAGPNKGTQDILNIQPVIPIHINEDWNVITRTILPLVWSPSLQPAQSVPFGLAPTTFPHFSHRRTRSMAGSGASGRSSSCRQSPARRWAPMCGVSVQRRSS